jgi:hypothetical protein
VRVDSPLLNFHNDSNLVPCLPLSCADVQTAAAGVALLEAELELALDELTLLCEKFNMALEIPESVDVEDDRGDRSSQSLPQAAGSETVLAESVPVNMVGAEAESVETQSAVVEDSQVEAPETKPEAPAQIVPARTAEYALCLLLVSWQLCRGSLFVLKLCRNFQRNSS